MLCFKHFPAAKIFVDKKRGESLFFRSKLFFSQGTESFRRGTVLCSRKVRVSKSFMPKREIKGLSIESLLSHSTENFVWNPSGFHNLSGIEKIYG